MRTTKDAEAARRLRKTTGVLLQVLAQLDEVIAQLERTGGPPTPESPPAVDDEGSAF